MDPGTILAVVTTSATVLSHITKYYLDAKDARQDRERLHKELKALQHVLENVQSLTEGPNASKVPFLSSYVKESCSPDIEELKNKLDPGKGRKAMKKLGVRALKWPFDKKEVDEYINKLERHKSTISAAVGMDQTSLIIGIDQNVTQLNQGHDLAELDRLLAKLSYTGDAAFNSHHLQHEPRCISNTRVDLLHRLQGWSNSSKECIFWLSGMAGTGKSTIARTIAGSISRQGHLGASFFFSRGGGDLGHAGKFVSTLAYQLAKVSPTLKRLICDAIAEQDDITHQGLYNQWKELIVRPLSRMGSSKSHLVFVIDALDECEREDDIKLILQLFIEAKDLTGIQLRVVLTSRPEVAIRLGFQDMPEIIHQNLDLRDIPRKIVNHDISEFLRHELGKIRKACGLPTDWADEKVIRLLVEKSDCLFIYAATACRFIGDRNWNPKKQLPLILQDVPDSSSTANLDDMYLQVLRHTISEDYDEKKRNELSKRFRQTVGPIIVSFDVLSSSAFEGLLSIERDDIVLALNPLHSVLNIPENRESPIRLLHPSFRDFLLDRGRCRDDHFWIDQEEVHVKLAKDCLRLLFNGLKRDICNLKSSGYLACEVQIDQIESYIPKGIQYACRYWVAHLEHVDPDHRNEIGLHDNGHIYSFFQKHFLHWLEALSLMRRMSEAVLMIMKLESLFKPDEHPALSAIVYDARRFILSNKSCIEEAPLQSYISALVFSPKQSVIRNQYLDQIPTWIKRFPVVEDNWGPLLQTLAGHSGFATAVAFSPDGHLVASASYDGTIRLWNATTGTLHHTLEDDSHCVDAVTFSPNGQLVASASYDKTIIRLWNSTTGTLHHTLEGHVLRIRALAFSSNSQLVACTSENEKIRFWDPTTGTLHHTLEGHSNLVRAVAFSPNGQLFASASDETVWLWDATTGTLHHTFESPVGNVRLSFSSNDQLVFFASGNRTIQFWDVTTGTLHHTLEGFPDWGNARAFSPNGQLIATASVDTVRLWDATTGTFHNTLESHSNLVRSVVFSPDGQFVASASFDGTIRLWDAKTEESIQQFDAEVTKISFSADGSFIETNRGQIQLTHIISHVQAQLSSFNFWKLEGKWLIWGAHMKLWLPPELRPTCSDICGNLFVIGCFSGRVWFIELSSGSD